MNSNNITQLFDAAIAEIKNANAPTNYKVILTAIKDETLNELNKNSPNLNEIHKAINESINELDNIDISSLSQHDSETVGEELNNAKTKLNEILLLTTPVTTPVANGASGTTPVTTPATKEENIYVKVDGLTYTILEENEAEKTMKDENDNKKPKTVFTMTRSDATKCFTFNDGSKPEEKKSWFSWGSKKPAPPIQVTTGGKLKTKKRRITKKRNQKPRPFKSRSKK